MTIRKPLNLGVVGVIASTLLLACGDDATAPDDSRVLAGCTILLLEE